MLFLSTTGAFTITELGYTIPASTVDFDILAQFTAEEVAQAQSLTTAILAGTVVWKKTAGGAVETPSNYDPDVLEVSELSTGPAIVNRVVRQGDLVQYFNTNLSYSLQQIGRLFGAITPDSTTKVTYLANGDVDFVEWFTSGAQVVGNRTAKAAYTYNGNLDPATEVLEIYAGNGTNILRTFTWVFTYTDSELTSYTRSLT